VRLPRPGTGVSPAWHLYVIAHPHADRLEAALARASVGHKAYYRTPIHRQPAMREWGREAELPATEEAARTHLAIPMSPVLTEEQTKEVVAAVASA
jgi:dTDP-4-amino-4,6-dideoxygalactose transaminase